MENRDKLLNISEISDNESYIDDVPQNTQNINDEILLKSISWNDLIDQEITANVITKTFEKCKKCSDVNDVINIKYDALTDLNILEYQLIIMTHLKKQFKSIDQNKYDVNDILLKIDWLFDTSKYLSDKMGLQIFYHKNISNNMVARSSYKFCNYNFECQFNYNIKKHCGCFAQHYVHNLVCADLNALKMYITSNKLTLNESKINEIRKSMNTLSFVINHMYDELKNAQKFNFSIINNTHIAKIPSKRKNKLVTCQSFF